MNARSPYEMKRLGSRVNNFDRQTWIKEAERVAHEACLAKFSQNRDLWKVLCDTGNKTLAEASRDAMWGVGVHLTSQHILDRGSWLGNNLLGKVLMRIRQELSSRD